MAAAGGFAFDVDEEDGADDDGAEEKEENSPNPQNRTLSDIAARRLPLLSTKSSTRSASRPQRSTDCSCTQSGAV